MKNRPALFAVLVSLLLGIVATTLLSGCKPPVVESSGPAAQQPSSNTTLDTGDPAALTASGVAVTDSQAPAADPHVHASPGDWGQWGGSSHRNNVPDAKNVPTDWNVGDFDRKTGAWIKDDAVNIKYVSAVGSQTYGNPVVSGGKMFVGTNNSAGYLPRYPGVVDLGCLICFDEQTGEFLWQHSSEKLPTGRVHDWPLQGICCAPLVEGDRVWFVTSRGEVKCVDRDGFYDGEDDGPVQREMARFLDVPASIEGAANAAYTESLAGLQEGTLVAGIRESLAKVGLTVPSDLEVTPGASDTQWAATFQDGQHQRDLKIMVAGPRLSIFATITPNDKQEADVVWSFNMMQQLEVSQHNMCSCSVTALGDILFVNTSNGLDESHINLPSPDAPSFIAMNKNTGEVYWTDGSPAANILHGQWSSPAVAVINGVPQAIFGGGDGWVYSFRADEGQNGKPTLLWKFDANPKASKWVLGGRGTRNNIIATPVVYDDLVYVAVGQDPEHGEGVGHLWCIDPSKKLDGSDVSPELAMKVVDGKRVPIPHRRLQAIIEEEGEVAVDNPDSAVVWHYSEVDLNGDGSIDFEETIHRSCGTVAIKDDLLYISDFSGLFHCLDAKGDGKGNPKVYWTYDMLAQAWGSPLIVEDKVYIGDEDGDVCIFNLSKEAHEPITEINMGNSVYSTPIVANGVLYIANKTHVFAISNEAGSASE